MATETVGFHGTGDDIANEKARDHLRSIETVTPDTSQVGGSRHLNDWPNEDGVEILSLVTDVLLMMGQFETMDEQRTPMPLKVSGKIPTYAIGTLYRTGPGTHKVDRINGTTWKASHWFDGFTQVHRFQIVSSDSSGSPIQVFYNSRRTVDKLLERIRTTGEFKPFSFGQKRDPCQSFFQKVMTVFTPVGQLHTGDPALQNIGVSLSVNMPSLEAPEHNGSTNGNPLRIKSLMSKTDANGYQFIDPETLEPIGLSSQRNLHPDLTGPMTATHAKSCPQTGDVFNFNLDVSKKAIYRIFCASAATQKTTILATITDAPGAYIHSLFLSANYVILCVWGSHFAHRGLSLLYHRNILDSIVPLDPSQPCRWYVVDRTPGGQGLVATYHSPAFYSFHTINAYEEASPTVPGDVDIVADLACYDDMSVLHRLYYDNVKSSSPGASCYAGDKGDSTRSWLGRWRLPSVCGNDAKLDGKVKTAVQVFAAPRSQSLELPTLNAQLITRRHRYVYGIADRQLSSFFDGIAKFDATTQTSVFWGEKAQSPGEPIFVRNPEGVDEDDGVLLSVVLDGYRGSSYLLCLDARDMRELGRADVNGVIGFGFHGMHIPATGVDRGNALDF